MKEKERMLNKNNKTLKLEKVTKQSIGRHQISRNELSKKRSLQEKGITLIALVVTIIILLILAGVTLNMALSQNGLFSKTKEAADKYKKAQEDEELEIEKIEYAADGKDITKVETISDEEGFKDFRKRVNKGDNFENTLVKLYCDVDLSGETWAPIGTVEYPFKGVFNGNGHTVTNLKLGKLNEYKGQLDSFYLGLFGCNEGIIKNIGVKSVSIEDTTIDGTCSIGIIAGYSSGIIEKCYNEANVTYTSSFRLGGIVGALDLNGIVNKCYNVGNLCSGTENSDGHIVGGIVAGVWSDGETVITQCYNMGNITCYQFNVNNDMVAGICGSQVRILDSCYNRGTITMENEFGSAKGYPVSGGLEGQTSGKNCEVVNSYNVGDVEVKRTGDAVNVREGSLVGLVFENDSVNNCFCYIKTGLDAIGKNFDGTGVNVTGVEKYESKDDLKNIADKLGQNFKADTNLKNEGYPILTWQED